MEVDQHFAYTKLILRGTDLKKHKAVLMERKQSANDLAGEKWILGNLKALSTKYFWTWEKSDGLAYNGGTYLELEKCVKFKN